MSRAAVLVGGPDPFLDAYWLRNFARWRDQVDELYMIVCGQHDRALREYTTAKATEVGVKHLEFGGALDHGVAIRRVMEHVSADVVMLCEEDAFVRRPAYIGEQFAKIESGAVDVVGCPRSTGTPGVIAWANDKWGEWTAQPTGEAGPILWPCFLFARKADLERTDRNYSVWGIPAGGEAMGHRFEDEQAMDTFGWCSLQLRELGLRFGIEPNYRADRDKMGDWGDPPWFHVGGMSTGYGMYICGPGAHKMGLWQHLRSQDLRDWTKRVAFWRLLAERSDNHLGILDEYRESVDELARETAMAPEEIGAWRGHFERLINW